MDFMPSCLSAAFPITLVKGTTRKTAIRKTGSELPHKGTAWFILVRSPYMVVQKHVISG